MRPDDGGPPIMERCSTCNGRGYLRAARWKKDGTLSKLAERVTCPFCHGRKRFLEGFEEAWRERRACPTLH